ncbi:MAG: TetR/AcrR family transcriptional regulator [Cyclobacteriaceae bacterium]|nr:TetR/AcrR family transcriptional regulator [Cyclobacteriaceae bacterium]
MAKEKRDNGTEKAILDAARKVFTHRGFAGARMDEIAREAGINRALLHYYFRSKDKLFDLVFAQRAREFFLGLAGIIGGPGSLEDKIKAIVEHDIDMIRSQPDLPIFIMQELTQNPDRLVRMAVESGANPSMMMKAFRHAVKEAVDKKVVRPIDAGQLLINVMSLCVYPFIAKPMIKAVQELDDKQFEKMILKRKQEIVEFVMSSLKP